MQRHRPSCPAHGMRVGPLRARSNRYREGSNFWSRARSEVSWWARQLRMQLPMAGNGWIQWLMIVVVAVAVASAVSSLPQFLGTSQHRSAASWVWWRKQPSAWSWANVWLFSNPGALGLAVALALCAAASMHSSNMRRKPKLVPKRQRQSPVRVSSGPATRAASIERSTPEQVEAQAKEMFQDIRACVREAGELRGLILFDSWGEAGRPKRPLTRSELQVLLEDAARFGQQPNMIKTLAAALQKQGVPLDWAQGYDCAGNLGRFALDSALEAAINENSDGEAIANLLLDLGLGSGAGLQGSVNGSVAQLNATPLLRAAAAKGMTKLIPRLARECGADVNARDPRYGSVALDRAVNAGSEKAALQLLELGADPGAGRGIDYVLSRAGPRVRAMLVKRGETTSTALSNVEQEPDASGNAVSQDLRRCVRHDAEASALAVLDAKLERKGESFRPADLAMLLEDAASVGYRPRLIKRICSTLEERGIDLGWADGSPDADFYGRRPLDAALQAAVDENPNGERVALLLLNLGLGPEGSADSAARLNANPLLRSAAAKCMPRLIEQLILRGGADVNAPDPRFGGTALERAVAAGCQPAVRKLLELGAKGAA